MSNESKPDLTPAEARAEIEAFLGEGWTADAVQFPDGNKQVHAELAKHIRLDFRARTYRAAVAALKQSWRDAVRPWVRSGVLCGGADAAETTHEIDTITARVLKESDHV